ncbi:transposase family protein [Streptomyces sp. NPDC006365]|uniref:helix-turn-helix domain-containing protein n=1 Tax=Streptomyces sp. NPDC006365 TaxID=3364744 RepID=UPI00367F9B81
MVFVDRLLVTLVHLRLGIPHAALAELYGVDRSTVSGAIREVRPLLATRGFAVPDRPGVRLRRHGPARQDSWRRGRAGSEQSHREGSRRRCLVS